MIYDDMTGLFILFCSAHPLSMKQVILQMFKPGCLFCFAVPTGHEANDPADVQSSVVSNKSTIAAPHQRTSACPGFIFMFKIKKIPWNVD